MKTKKRWKRRQNKQKQTMALTCNWSSVCMQAQNAYNLSHSGVQATQHKALDNWCVDGCYVCPALLSQPQTSGSDPGCRWTPWLVGQQKHNWSTLPPSQTCVRLPTTHCGWLKQFRFSARPVLFLAPDVTPVHRPQVYYHVDSTWIMPPNTGAPGGINHIKYIYFFFYVNSISPVGLNNYFLPPPPPFSRLTTYTLMEYIQRLGETWERKHTHTLSHPVETEREERTHTHTHWNSRRGGGGGRGGGAGY